MSNCREPACRADMVWVTNDRNGRRVPYDTEPVRPGSDPSARPVAELDDGERRAYGPNTLAQLLRDGDPALTYDAAMRRVYDQFPWHVPHAITCPARAPEGATR